MSEKIFSHRDFLRMSAVTTAGLALVACAPAAVQPGTGGDFVHSVAALCGFRVVGGGGEGVGVENFRFKNDE